MVQLDKDKPEKVFVFESKEESTFRFSLSQEPPYRLFADLNRDRKCQPNEIFTSTAGNDLYRFDKVLLPVEIHDATLAVPVMINAFFRSGDCRVLSIHPIQDEHDRREEPIFWPLRNVWLTSKRAAFMHLDRKEQERAFVLETEGSHPAKVWIVEGIPFRLLCDLNSDGQWQPNEVFDAAKSVQNRWARFENATVAVQVGETTQAVQANLSVSLGGDRGSLRAEKICSYYEGSILLAGEQYAARMGFQSLFPLRNRINEVVILDTNRDGFFDHLDDVWFSSEGFLELSDQV